MSKATETIKEKVYGKESILNLYEDKLYYTKGQPLWMNWVEAKPEKPLMPKEDEAIKFSNPLPKQVDKHNEHSTEIKIPQFRDIRCCSCSCIGNVGLVEKTEEILDILTNCSYTCGTNLLNVLPHIKKKKQNTLSKDINSNSHKVQQFDLLPDQRRRILSYFEGPGNRNDSLDHKAVISPQETVEITRSHSTTVQLSSQAYCAELNAERDLVTDRSLAKNSAVRSVDGLRNNTLPRKKHNFEDENDQPVGVLAVEKRQNIPNQLVYSYHRSLLAAGKMKHHAGKKPVRVHLLTGESILLVFDPKACVKEVFEQICAMHAIKETHFFGLSAIVENEHRFMDLKQKLSKYAPKEWGKEPRRRGSDMSVQPSSIFTLQFQVQYYVEHPKLICNMESRHHYYLQLKRNVLQSKVAVQDEVIFTLAAAALHVDMGPFDPSVHKGKYFDPHDFVPAWFLKKWDENYLWLHLPPLHEELATTSAFQALADYIQQASTIDDVPVHYYRLFKNKKETDPSVVMGIFHQGVRIHHVAPQRMDGPHLLDFEFPWNKVGRLFFAGKRFEIYPEDLPSSRKLMYFTGSRSRSKYLLRLLRDTHSLFMSLSPFVDHMRKVDGKNGRRKFRESYISGMDLHEKMTSLDERLVGGLGKDFEVHSKQNGGQCLFTYQSSLSNGSSRTSGIGSDVRHRADDVIEDEDDDAFEAENAVSKLSKPSSGNSSMTKQEHLVASSSHTCSKLAEKMSMDKNGDTQTDSNEYGGEKQESSSKEVPPKAEESAPESFLLQRVDSLKSQETVLLDTHTMTSKTATLKKNSPKNSVGDNFTEPSDPTSKSGSTSSESAKMLLEDTITSILYDSNLEPPSQEPNPSSSSIETKEEPLDATLKSNGHIHKKEHKHHHKHIHKTFVDAAAVHRAHSNDSAMHGNCSGPSRSKETDPLRHRRNKSVHDAEASRNGSPSGKHFAAPLTQKKSLEDITAALQTPLNRTEPHLDIAKTLGMDKRNNSPSQSGSAPATPNHMSCFDKGPIVAVNWGKSNDTGLGIDTNDYHRRKSSGFKTNIEKENRNGRRRSDISGLVDSEPKLNGYKPGSAGHTPGKKEMILHHGKNRCRPVSYHIYPEIDIPTTTDNDTLHETIPTSRHAPIYVDNFKEVIV